MTAHNLLLMMGIVITASIATQIVAAWLRIPGIVFLLISCPHRVFSMQVAWPSDPGRSDRRCERLLHDEGPTRILAHHDKAEAGIQLERGIIPRDTQ